MKKLLSYQLLVPIALLLGLAPFYPEPHIAEKLKMLLTGTLNKPIDVFDLFWHAWPFALLALRLALDLKARMARRTGMNGKGSAV